MRRKSNKIQSPSSVVRDTDDVRLKSCLKRSNPGMVSDQKAAAEEGSSSTDRRLHGSLSSGSGSKHSSGPHSRSSSTRGSVKSGSRTDSAASSKSQSSSLHSERHATGASTGSGSLSSGSGSKHSDGPHSRSSSTRGSVKSGSRTDSAASSKSQSSSLHSERHATGASTGSGSLWRKAVRFNRIYIREYERTLGDNPSCSSGPPVGIGWDHGTTNVVSVNRYESDRPYKRSQQEMVLSREEREEMLQEWTIPHDDVIQATRDNVKAKFQRRRTVRNVRRVENLEIAFECAAKSLKRALHLRKRTPDEVNVMEEQANLEAQALDAARVGAHHDLAEPIIDDGVIGISEPDDDDDAWNKIEASNTRESMVDAEGRLPFTLDDSASAVSGMTFDSTTASVMEMERFYRELELEMFGSSNHQTLELPESEKAEQAWETCSATEDVSSSSSMPSFTSFRNNEAGRRFHSMELGVSPPMQQPTIHQQVLHTPNYQGGSLVYPPTHRMQYNPYARTSAYRGYSLRDAYRGNQSSAFDMASSMVPASRIYSGERGYEERQVSMESQINPLGSPHSVLFEREELDQCKSSTIQDDSDGPTIKNLPYSTVSTVTKWMEDPEPVTISEDQIYYDPRPELLDPAPLSHDSDGPTIKNLPYSTVSTVTKWMEDPEPVTISEDQIYYDPRPELLDPAPLAPRHC